MAAMKEQYGEEEGERVFYASRNKGTIEGVDKEFSTERRETLATEGKAMKGGGFPIENESDLKNAIHAIGRAKNPKAAKAHIKKRARALGKSDLIPENWDAAATDNEDTDQLRFDIDDRRPKKEDTNGDDDDDEDDDWNDSNSQALDHANSIQMTDHFVMDGVRKTRDGYLVANARIARTGVQLYSGHEVGDPTRKIVRIYRSPDEVFDHRAMHSLAHRPITLAQKVSEVDCVSCVRNVRVEGPFDIADASAVAVFTVVSTMRGK